MEKQLHTFEAGRRGKPDELDGNLANVVAAHFLSVEPRSRFDVRFNGGFNPITRKPRVRLSGEISDVLDSPEINKALEVKIRSHYSHVHQLDLEKGDIEIVYAFKPQSGVLSQNTGAGDLGTSLAVAFRNGPNYLPWERWLAVEIRNLMDEIYFANNIIPVHLANGASRLPSIRPDGKVDVDVYYRGAEFDSIGSITLALQQHDSTKVEELRHSMEPLLRKFLESKGELLGVDFGRPLINVNTLDDWYKGGWEVDEGNREAKPQRVYFGSHGVTEDTCYGEDPSKPSGTGTFLARYIAVQIVSRGLADFARVILKCHAGQDEVILANVYTKGTSTLPQEELENWVRQNIDLSFNNTIQKFGLRDSQMYRNLALQSDYFHSPDLPWNKPDQELARKKGYVVQNLGP